jgi:hypothetical protein
MARERYFQAAAHHHDADKRDENQESRENPIHQTSFRRGAPVGGLPFHAIVGQMI